MNEGQQVRDTASKAHPTGTISTREDVPEIVEKERFSLGAYSGDKLPRESTV